MGGRVRRSPVISLRKEQYAPNDQPSQIRQSACVSWAPSHDPSKGEARKRDRPRSLWLVRRWLPTQRDFQRLGALYLDQIRPSDGPLNRVRTVPGGAGPSLLRVPIATSP